MKDTLTFIYPCRPGDNEELRYSLRSIEKFYPEADVWVIGGKPSWYNGNFIPVKQTYDSFTNVRNSLSMIIDNPFIPDDVIVMNDDFFFLDRMEKFLFYVSGTLKDRILFDKQNNINSSYTKKLVHLHNHCSKYTQSPLDFDIHVPMPINKKKLKLIINESLMWRSNYGNRFAPKTKIKKIRDVKVYPNSIYSFKSYDYKNPKYPFISTHDDSFNEVYEHLLKDLLQNPSRFELSKTSFSS